MYRFVAQTLWLIYTAMLLNIPAVCSNVLQLVSALISITRAYLLVRKNRNAVVVADKAAEENTEQAIEKSTEEAAV